VNPDVFIQEYRLESSLAPVDGVVDNAAGH